MWVRKRGQGEKKKKKLSGGDRNLVVLRENTMRENPQPGMRETDVGEKKRTGGKKKKKAGRGEKISITSSRIILRERKK